MPLLFSYGSLQDEAVQLSTFGRLLHGRRDELHGFALGTAGPHANVARTGRDLDRVGGVAFEITGDELTAADAYEGSEDYVRIEVVLASGMTAWVYVHGPSVARTGPD